MWHEYFAYMMIAGAFLYTAYRICKSLKNPKDAGICATCTEACKLRGMKRPPEKEKDKNCRNKQENHIK